MKRLTTIIVSVSVFSLAGCHKKEVMVDAAQPLVQSFAAAQPEVKQAILTVSASLKSGDYSEALKSLAPVVADGGKLTDPQKQAVVAAIQQVNQALAANPALDTKELYDQRVKLIKAVRGF